MAVAVVVSRFPVATQTFVLRELDELERQGVRVLLVALRRGRDELVHPAARPWMERALRPALASPHLLLENLRLLLGRPRLYLGTLLRLVWAARRRPRTVPGILAVFPAAVWLAARLRSEGVSHVHAHFASYASVAAHVASTLSRHLGDPIPYSVTVHGSDLFLSRGELGGRLAGAAFVRSISRYNARFLERRLEEGGVRVDRARLPVIHCGVDPTAYRRRPRPPLAAGDRPASLLCVASLMPHKGLTHLVDAVARLRRSGLDVRCDVVGTGPMRPQLLRRIREAGLEGRVRLLGARTEAQVAEALAASDLFLLPSQVAPDGRREGIPVSLMEAMAAGLPVVATRLTGIPELVVDGETGRLVEPGDAEGLATAVSELLANPDRASRLGAAAQEKIRAEFSLEACVRRLLGEITTHGARPTG